MPARKRFEGRLDGGCQRTRDVRRCRQRQRWARPVHPARAVARAATRSRRWLRERGSIPAASCDAAATANMTPQRSLHARQRACTIEPRTPGSRLGETTDGQGKDVGVAGRRRVRVHVAERARPDHRHHRRPPAGCAGRTLCGTPADRRRRRPYHACRSPGRPAATTGAAHRPGRAHAVARADRHACASHRGSHAGRLQGPGIHRQLLDRGGRGQCGQDAPRRVHHGA